MAAYQSLYRRYRPQRFDEVLGQDHVTRALRNAVRDGRVGHAYLFSGPRGTGKTSTARILAKVLNCARPIDGEPCGECESCLAVESGRLTDWLLEQDAASKSKVDDMRDLLDRVPLGTSGNRKVIILDEVHMLSQGAENALLKTLEEPPEHVVFVLATTDPQKVRPTIRSRGQHFEFRLLPPDLLAGHVRRVIADAGLDVADLDAAVEYVVRTGGGSARDALSALDQVAALGEVLDDPQPVDAILEALCERDAGAVLVAVAEAMAVGRDPRALGETLIARLREAFLSLMGAADQHVPEAGRERAAAIGERLGAPGVTRALEVLGEALTELSRKPDPRIVLEVALVRLTRVDVDRTLDTVLERLDRLERGRAAPGSEATEPGASARAALAQSAPIPPTSPEGTGTAREVTANPPGASDPPTPSGAGMAEQGHRGRTSDHPPGQPAPGTVHAAEQHRSPPTLGAVRRGQGQPAEAAGDPESAKVAPAPAAEPTAGRSAPSPATARPQGPVRALPTREQIALAWGDEVLQALPRGARSRWRGGQWLDPADGSARFAVPNEWHQRECGKTQGEVESALAAHFGHPFRLAIVVDDSTGAAPAGSPGDVQRAAPGSPGLTPPTDDSDDEQIDPSELVDADDAVAGGVDLLVREFDGELVDAEEDT